MTALAKSAEDLSSHTASYLAEHIKDEIVVHEDFPKPGVRFYDVMPVFGNARVHAMLHELLKRHAHMLVERSASPGPINAVVGIEARGLLMGPTLALNLECAFVPARKPGKLPGAVVAQTYSKEYGEDKLEMQAGAIKPGDRVIIVDDLLATGGTLKAAVDLVRKMGGVVMCAIVIVKFKSHESRDFGGVPVWSIMLV